MVSSESHEIQPTYQRPELWGMTVDGRPIDDLFAQVYTEPPEYDANFVPTIPFSQLIDTVRAIRKSYMSNFGRELSVEEAVAVMAENAHFYHFANRNSTIVPSVAFGDLHAEKPLPYVLEAVWAYEPDLLSASDVGGMSPESFFTKLKPLYYQGFYNSANAAFKDAKAHNQATDLDFYSGLLEVPNDPQDTNSPTIGDGLEDVLRAVFTVEKPKDHEYSEQRIKTIDTKTRAELLKAILEYQINHGEFFGCLPLAIREGSLSGALAPIQNVLATIRQLQGLRPGALGIVYEGNLDGPISWDVYSQGSKLSKFLPENAGIYPGSPSSDFPADLIERAVRKANLQYMGDFGYVDTPDALHIYLPFFKLYNFDPASIAYRHLIGIAKSAHEGGKRVIGHAHAVPYLEIHGQKPSDDSNTISGKNLLQIVGELGFDFVTYGHMHDNRGGIDPNKHLVVEFNEGQKPEVVTDLKKLPKGRRTVFVYTPPKEAAVTMLRKHRLTLPPKVIRPPREDGPHPERIKVSAYWGVENSGMPIQAETAFVTDVVSASFNTLALMARGAEKIYIAGSDAAVHRALAHFSSEDIVLVGESSDHTLKFICNNNPLNVMNADVKGKVVILKTHNGTATIAETYKRLGGDKKRVFSFHWANIHAAENWVISHNIYRIALVASGGREEVFSEHRLLEDWYAVLGFNQLLKGVPITEERHRRYILLTRQGIDKQYPANMKLTEAELSLLLSDLSRFSGILPEYRPVFDNEEELFEVINALKSSG
jgi:phosphosulfolactate phosphohydrolase-like enzyme